MFADDQEEMGTPGDEMDEAAETMKMDDSAEKKPAKAKKEKKPGDWITVETPKISKADAAAAKKESAAPQAAAPKPAPPPPSPIEATMMDAPSAGATATPSSTSAASHSAPMVESTSGGSSVPLGGMLANMGVKDEKTQKIIVYAGGGLIALCCLCSCVIIFINFALPLLGN